MSTSMSRSWGRPEVALESGCDEVACKKRAAQKIERNKHAENLTMVIACGFEFMDVAGLSTKNYPTRHHKMTFIHLQTRQCPETLKFNSVPCSYHDVHYMNWTQRWGKGQVGR